MTPGLDYGQMVLLDAEDLGEGGIKDAYEALLPALRKYVDSPSEIEVLLDDENSSYVVRAGGREYVVYSPKIPDGEYQSWGRATFVFFSIVNHQMAGSKEQFFAINGGNDLGGMFLTQSERDAAIQLLDDRRDWPYIPTEEPPWYGQPH